MRIILLAVIACSLGAAEITFGGPEAASGVATRARVGGDLAAPTIAAALPWRIGEMIASSPVVLLARLEVVGDRITGLRSDRVFGATHAISPDGLQPIITPGDLLPFDFPAAGATSGMQVIACVAVVPGPQGKAILHPVVLPEDQDLPAASPLIASPDADSIALVDRMVRLREAGVGMYRPSELFSPLTASLGIQPTAWDRRALVAWVRQAREDAEAKHPRPFGFADWLNGSIAVARDPACDPWLRRAMVRNILGFASWATPAEITTVIDTMANAVQGEKIPAERTRLASVFIALTTGVNNAGDQARIARAAADVSVALAVQGTAADAALVRILSITAARLSWPTTSEITAALQRLQQAGTSHD